MYSIRISSATVRKGASWRTASLNREVKAASLVEPGRLPSFVARAAASATPCSERLSVLSASSPYSSTKALVRRFWPRPLNTSPSKTLPIAYTSSAETVGGGARVYSRDAARSRSLVSSLVLAVLL